MSAPLSRVDMAVLVDRIERLEHVVAELAACIVEQREAAAKLQRRIDGTDGSPGIARGAMYGDVSLGLVDIVSARATYIEQGLARFAVDTRYLDRYPERRNHVTLTSRVGNMEYAIHLLRYSLLGVDGIREKYNDETIGGGA